jgi:hypothetical protein
VDELIERLRSVKWEVTDDCGRMPDDPTHKCVFVDMRPDDFRELLREAAAALDQARADAARYRWLKKSAFCNVWARGDGIALVVPRTPMADIDSRIDAAIDRASGKGGCGEGVGS